MELKTGTEIAGRYTLERLLGHGGMGAVYLAHDAKFGERVAIKIAAATGGAYEQFRERFVREARIGNRLGRLSGFVRAFDWGEFDGAFLYLGMDLVVDATALDLLSGTLAERLQRFAVAAVLVGQAHSEGIVHRDLKPDNFLQQPDGTILLTDFGLAKILNEEAGAPVQLTPTHVALTNSRMGLGTPRYMAPEQFEDAKNVDARADVYSLGVMLFLALTGRTPYTGDSALAYAAQHTRVRLGEQPAPRPKDFAAWVPDALDALCTEAIALHREERIASVDVLLAGLEAALTQAASDETGPPLVAPAPIAPKEPAEKTKTKNRSTQKRKRRATPANPNPPPDPLPAGLEATDVPDEFLQRTDGSTLLWIPAGTFRMGSKAAAATPEEAPVHKVTLTRGFFMGKHAVTWDQYRAFCAAAGWTTPPAVVQTKHGSRTAGGAHPVFNVTWQEAYGYATWAGLRLPTEAEWEYAARGLDGRSYPWGKEQPDAKRCNWAGHPSHGGRITCPVGSFPAGASPFGCEGMAGNVWEWVWDWYERYSRWIVDDPTGPAQVGEPFKVARGGSWSSLADLCRTTTRRRVEAMIMRSNNLGFRIACSPST